MKKVLSPYAGMLYYSHMTVPYDPEHITYFGETDFRNQRTRFGIKSRDRTRHMYVIGKSGVGKSTLLENMAIQDIAHGEGVAVLDPHGSFAEKMLDYIPAERIKDVIYFAPFDTNYPVSFNVLEDVGADKRHFVASGLMSTFKKIWVDAWSARMEYILNNILLALLEYPGATLLGVNRMLSDKTFRNKVVANCTDPGVKAFWVEEFAKYGERYMQEAGAAIQNKIGQFTANPLVRNIIGQPKSSFDIRTAMDEQKILIINLSKGRIGEQNTSLLGSMIITKIYLAAMSRADATADRMTQLPNFYFYVDEFQSFANESFANILSEARKYKLALIIAHQYVAQMEESVRDAVFGNVGTSISFRVGPLDAELLEKVYSPQFMAGDLINLGMAQIYLSLMINDMGSAPFSARTLPPLPRPTITYRNDVIEWTRQTYAHPKENVDTNIREWYAEDADTGEDKPKKNIPENPFKQTFASAPYNPDALAKIVAVQSAPAPTAPVPTKQTPPSPDAPAQFMRRIERTATVAKKPMARAFTPPQALSSITLPDESTVTTTTTAFTTTTKTVGHVPREAASTPASETSALSSLLSSLDKQSDGTVLSESVGESVAHHEAPAPFNGEKTLRDSIPPVKVAERGPTEKNRDLLKAALQSVLASSTPAPQPPKPTPPPPQRVFTPRPPQQASAPTPPPPTALVSDPEGNEVSTAVLQKVLE